jgi:protein O-mannosyl-transferase
MTFFNRKIVHLLIIVAVGLLIYLRTLQVPFVLDDFESIVNNPLITNFSFFRDLESGSGFFGHAGFASRWFGYLTFALNYRVHGHDLAGYHLVNIAIHLAAALSVYQLVILTFRTPYFLQGQDPVQVDSKTAARAGFIALLAALLFVCHPLQTQAVTYLIQRLASLVALLYLVSLTCYIRGRLASAGQGRFGVVSLAWFAASLLAAFLAVKTKQNSYTLPIALLCYELMFFNGAGRRKLLRALLALGALAGLAGVAAALWSGRSWGELLGQLDRATRLQTDLSRWDYLATQFRVIVTYLRLVIWPSGQRLDYDYPISRSFLEPDVLFCGALLGTLLAGALYCLYRSRGRGGVPDGKETLLRLVAYGIFWFFITISIESSIIPIVDVIFEHRVYLPLAGLFMAAAALISLAGGECAQLPGWPKLPVLAGLAGVLLLFSGLTVARNNVWLSEVGLWEDNSWKCPKKARVYLNLGSAAERAGDMVGAESAYSTAITIAPDSAFSRLDLGRLYQQWNRQDDALAQFREALRVDPGMGEVHNNIGSILETKKQYDEALKEYQLAVQSKPYLAVPYCNIGAIYVRQARFDAALKEFDKAIVRDPSYLQAFVNRGSAYLASGRRSEAVADFRRALQINPGNAEALQQLKAAGGAP